MHAIFLLGNLKGRDHLEDICVDWRIIFRMDLGETWCESVDWIHLFHYRDQWWTLVKMVMNFQVP
jgi:hypothetical protein